VRWTVRSAVKTLGFAGLVAVVLAGCNPPANDRRGAEPAGGFSSRLSENLSGEYAPGAPVRVGGKALEGLYLGQGVEIDLRLEARRTLGGDGVVIRGTLEVGGERSAVAFSRASAG
jgi:uncharacterized membrane protein